MIDHAPAAALDQAPPRRGDGPSGRLYRWTMALAETRSAPLALGVIAFCESSFFPLPPDLILVPMTLAKPHRAWTYAAICTFCSVAGALLGYAIGALLYATVGHWLIHLYGYDGRIADLSAFFARWGWAFILVKGLTPIPFKLVTIFCGLVSYDLPLFVLLCTVTRGARFLAIAVLLRLFGTTLQAWLRRFFGVFMLGLALVVVAGFVIAARLV